MPSQFSFSSARLCRVQKLQFGILSPDEVRQMSVLQKVKVNEVDIPEGVTKYDLYKEGSAVYGGANDPRMGTLDFNTRCRTCDCTYTGIGGNQVNDCPGHFGHMELARPVYHVGFLDVTLKVLRSVCFHCSRLRLDKADLKYKRALLIKNPKTRLNYIHEQCRNSKKCVFGTGDLEAGMELDGEGGGGMGGGGEDGNASGCGGLLVRMDQELAEGRGVFLELAEI